MNAKKILIYGEILFDHFDDGTRHLGGAPFNVAWHLQRFSFYPLLISALGEDIEGREITQRMLDWGMDVSGVATLNNYPTGRVDVILNHGEPTYTIQQNCAYDAIPIPDNKILANAELLYFGSLALRNKISKDTLKFIKESFTGTTFVDINIRYPWFNSGHILPLIKNCNWIKLNIDEFNDLCSVPFSKNNKELQFVLNKFCSDYGIGHLILTVGEDGAYLYQKSTDALFYEPIKNIPVFISAVGAGDAFSATVIRGIVEGWSPEKILREATSFASKICEIQGATSREIDFYTMI